MGLEVLVRLAGLDRSMVWQPHPQIGWWHIPGASTHWREEGDGLVQISSQGLRDVERKLEKPAGVFRIAVFGDSMTEAVQVNLEQTFTRLLERKLNDSRLNVEVLNFGVNGYSPLQEYLLYRHIGKAFNPDLVLHAVFLDNDIAASDPALATGQVGAPFVRGGSGTELDVDYSRAEASTKDYQQQPMFTIRRWSAVYRAVGGILRTRAGSEEVRQSLAKTGGIPKRHLLYLDPPEAQWDVAWLTYERILDAFAAEVKSDGSRFAVVSVPAGQVVDSTVWLNVLQKFPEMGARTWNTHGPEDRLTDIVRKRGLPLIAPLARFQGSLAGGPLFFDGMGHLTPRGHEVMAGSLADELSALALVPLPRVIPH